LQDRRKFTQIEIFGSKTNHLATLDPSQAGRPDWGIFRILGGYLLWPVLIQRGHFLKEKVMY
jgi:hypothetical protein